MKNYFYEEALTCIENELPICYDIAAENGQQFKNVKHMSWFIDAVADYLQSQEEKQ